MVIALDAACGFSQHLLHGAGTKAPSPAMLTHLYAAILAQATNLGPVAMARASGLSYDQVAHATAWYLREETLTAAIDEVINYHHGLAASGGGATARSPPPMANASPFRSRRPTPGRCPATSGSARASRCSPR